MSISGLVVCAATLTVWIDYRNHKAVGKILKRADTLEVNYAKKHEYDLDLFRNASAFDTLEVKFAKKHEHDLDLFRKDSGFEEQA